MNTQEAIARIDRQIELLNVQRAVLVALAAKLQELNEEIHISICGDHIDFDNPTRAQAVKLMTHLAVGKWHKEEGPSQDTINYIHDGAGSGVKLRLYAAEPPPSCRIVEVEEIIPAQPEQIVKRRKLVCQEDENQTV